MLAQTVVPFNSIPTNQSGSVLLFEAPNWVVSKSAPDVIQSDTISLVNGITSNSLHLDSLRKEINGNKYGWAELSFTVAKEEAKKAYSIKFSGYSAANIWLNGNLVHKAGEASKNPENERLNHISNTYPSDVVLKEGENHILVEFSYLTLVEELHLIRSNPDRYVKLYFVPKSEPLDQTLRAFFFGASLFTLLILIFSHGYLATKSIHKYHLYATLSNIFIIVHLYISLLQSLFGLSYDHIFLYEFTSVILFIFALYYLIISIRSFYKLSIPFTNLRIGTAISILIGLYALFFNSSIIIWLHLSIFSIVFLYANYTLYEKKKTSTYGEIYSLMIGLFITLFGIFCYIYLYRVVFVGNEILYLISIVCVYIGIPLSFLITISQDFVRTFYSIEEQVKDRTKELEDRDSFKSRFLANISHELRTPVTILNGLVTKAISKQKHADRIEISVQEAILINRNIDRLSTLVSQIVSLSKSDADDIMLNLKLFSVDEIIHNSIELTSSIFELKHQKIEVIGDASNVLLKVDGEKTLTIITNLLTNASKFSPANSVITIERRINVKLETLEIDVIDEGIGVKQEDEELIFERFYRLKNTHSDYVEGMGIGLELSRVFARKHGGDIKVVPHKEVGARFRFSLPFKEHLTLAQLSNKSTKDEMSAAASKKNVTEHVDYLSEKVPHILLVEDNPDLQKFISDLLQDVGQVSVSSDGISALEILSNVHIDLVVTDLMMPNMTGEELIKRMAEDATLKSIPIVVLSAKDIEENRLNLLRVGIIDYITKPFNSEELILKIGNLLKLSGIRKKAHITIDTDEVEPTVDLSESAKAFILSKISDSSLTSSDLANHFLMSERSLYRKLERETGLTPAAFIREVRLQYAARLIEVSSDLRLNELADKVGYKSTGSFKKAFITRFGKSPF